MEFQSTVNPVFSGTSLPMSYAMPVTRRPSGTRVALEKGTP